MATRSATSASSTVRQRKPGGQWRRFGSSAQVANQIVHLLAGLNESVALQGSPQLRVVLDYKH